MRKEIAWISPLQTGIIYAAIIAAVYVVFGILALIFGGMGAGGMQMMGGGIGALFFGIIMGAIFGFIGGAVSAFVYNVAAGIVGGIVIELKDA